MQSKEEKVLELFFNSPTREWHFEEIISESKIARSKADRWIKQFLKDGLIERIKVKGKMPYYQSRYDSPAYQNKKKLFALKRFFDSGFLNHLASLKKAKTVILFGSFARSDWYKESDIDIFIYGRSDDFEIGKYESNLHREIQLFVAESKNDLKKMGTGLIKNILKGNLIKGDIDFVKVGINA